MNSIEVKLKITKSQIKDLERQLEKNKSLLKLLKGKKKELELDQYEKDSLLLKKVRMVSASGWLNVSYSGDALAPFRNQPIIIEFYSVKK